MPPQKAGVSGGGIWGYPEMIRQIMVLFDKKMVLPNGCTQGWGYLGVYHNNKQYHAVVMLTGVLSHGCPLNWGYLGVLFQNGGILWP